MSFTTINFHAVEKIEFGPIDLLSPFERHVEAGLIEARRVVFDPAASWSYRKLCARVLRMWGHP